MNRNNKGESEVTGRNDTGRGQLAAHISLLGAWALAFGCAVGWDSFVLPWTSFLPKAGPLGAILGLVAGGAIMAVIAWNYHYMVCRHPGPGGAYTYAKAAFGIDHGFLCAWFLLFAYVSITWMDASVLAYFLQHTWGVDFKVGLHYSVAGHDVTIVHIGLSFLAIAYAAAACSRRKFAVRLQTVFSVVFAGGIVFFLISALARHAGGLQSMTPGFAPGAGSPFSQVLGIIAISPWLFVGFASITHSSGEFAFPEGKSFKILAISIVTIVVAYAALTLIPTLVPQFAPGGAFPSWREAVSHVDEPNANDIAFGTVGSAFFCCGRAAVSIIFLAAIFTNLIGNTIAASRLLMALADDGALPRWFGARNSDGAPRNAVLGIAAVSVVIFALGEAVIGIVVDLALVGAAVAYVYTSAATFKLACLERRFGSAAAGFAGLVLSSLLLCLFILPMFSENAATMSTASYLVLVLWCVAGLIMFLSVFRRDGRNRFGKSPVVWFALAALIVFLSVLWIRQKTADTSRAAFEEITEYHDHICPSPELADTMRAAISARQTRLTRAFLDYSAIQTGLTVLSLLLMLYLFLVLRRREREREEEKARAKSLFFSAVSHDMRTPLNAILGFSEMLKDGFTTEEERRQALDSILVSGKTLLALVNDILDLSKLEAGKMEISPEPTDFHRLAHDIIETFRTARAKPEVELRLSLGPMPPLMLDPQRMRQIIFNLVGNAVKFTDRGHIELRASFAPGADGASGLFRLDVEDTGRGISAEDIAKLASAYVQVGDKRARNGGTGLGLLICRQLAQAMGGRLEVASSVGEGSTFSVILPGVQPFAGAGRGEEGWAPAEVALPRRILIADDSKLNLIVLKGLLAKIGEFDITTVHDGSEALAELRKPGAPPFDLVLTDLWMPNLDGEGLIRAIRSDPALSGQRVALVTADVELRRKYAELGFDGILLKPITVANLNTLFSKIAKIGGNK